MTDRLDIDPYAPPRVVVADPIPAGCPQFPHFNTWWVLLLSIVTLGLYVPYWLYTRTKILNRLSRYDPIPIALPVALPVLCVLCVAIGFVDGIYPDRMGVKPFLVIVQWTYMIVTLICEFSFRNRLNEDCLEGSDSPYWVGLVATFFFGILYLNYKLNQRVETEQGRNPSASVTAQWAGDRA